MKDKMYAASESNFIFEIDPKTLETLRRVDFEKEFPGNLGKQKNMCSIFPLVVGALVTVCMPSFSVLLPYWQRYIKFLSRGCH